MPTPYKGFSALIYYHLIHTGKQDVAKVAPLIGVSPSSLYKYAQGESTFPPDLIPALYNATKECDFLNFCTKGTDRITAPSPSLPDSARSLEMETLDVSTAVGVLSAHIINAIEDGKLSAIEKREIEKAIGNLQQEVEGVRQKLLRTA